jgi:hypothetical protein
MENFKNVIVTEELTVKQVRSVLASLNFSKAVQTILAAVWFQLTVTVTERQ